MSHLRFALRQLIKSPGYTAVVVLTLGLGIAVNTQIFAMLDTIFIQPLQVRDGDRAVAIVERSNSFNLPHSISFPDVQDMERMHSLDAVACFQSGPAHVSLPGKNPERRWIEIVTPGSFATFGVKAFKGRTLEESDGALPPGKPVAVITHTCWESRFNSDPDILGRLVTIDGQAFTIVGVLDKGFESFNYSLGVDLFVPSGAISLVHPGDERTLTNRGYKSWRVIALRKPGVSVAQVNAELGVLMQRLVSEFPEQHRSSRFHAVTEHMARPDPSMCDLMPGVIAIFGSMVVLVLGIACANVANLMAARAVTRERELVVRSALGASRGKLIQQLLVESLVLAAVAGVVGFVLAIWGGDFLRASIPTGDMPIVHHPAPRHTLYLFTAGLTLLTGLASGLLPALRATRIDLNASLQRAATRGGTERKHRLRDALVVGQVALSCIVLVAGALFIRALNAATHLPLGFTPGGLLMLSADMGLQGYSEENGLQWERDVIERVRALPGVQATAFTEHVPFGYEIKLRNIFPENAAREIPPEGMTAAYSGVSPGFTAALGIPLLSGREFTDADNRDEAPRVAVINERMAKMFWPGRDPLGQHFRLSSDGKPFEVVGVTPTGRYVMLGEEPRAYFYTPIAQHYDTPVTLLVRSSGNLGTLAVEVRKAIRDLDPDMPFYSVVTATEHMDTSVFALMPLRTGAMLAVAQGSVGLVLAIMGLYAVVSYGVSRRTREIGVRMALGASARDVLGLVCREGMKLTLIGLAIGLILASALGYALSRTLFGLHAVEPLVLGGATVILVGTSLLACGIPARRAIRVDPVEALRAE